jgi:hypothetical protein
VITSGDNGELQIWDLVTLKEIYNFHFDFPYSLRHPAISNDGLFIAIESGYLILLKPKITSVEENILNIVRTLYPNPTTQIVTVELNLKKRENIILNLSDNSGKILNSINYGIFDVGYNNIKYNTSIISTGIYYITIQSQSFSETYKLVKE